MTASALDVALKNSEVGVTRPLVSLQDRSQRNLPSPDITTLSQRLCAPVNGFGTSLLNTISAVSTKQYSISTTPTIPPGVTGQPAVSSILATVTPAPNLGNPANILTYPNCAVRSDPSFYEIGASADLSQQICSNETAVIGGDPIGTSPGNPNDLSVACGVRYRSLTAGCEAATCNATDYQKTQLLAQQLCGSYYNQNATLGASVSSAIASQTAIARAATQGKDPKQFKHASLQTTTVAVAVLITSNASVKAFKPTKLKAPVKSEAVLPTN
ncbi:MAG: hypothetical protein Q9218_007088 [Villophora microphyllina]